MNETGTAGASRRKGVLDHIEFGALMLAGFAIVGVVLVQAWQVFARYVLNDSPSWTEPTALVLIGVTAMFGAAVGVRRETHFAFTTLADAAPPLVKGICRTAARLAMLVLGLGLAWYGAVLATNSWAVDMAGAPLSVGLRFVPIAIGGLLIAVFAGERIVRSAGRGSPLAQPTDIGEDA
jgi:TRAP-type C4-dicarboxylate transport system permease small subunit